MYITLSLRMKSVLENESIRTKNIGYYKLILFSRKNEK